MQFNDDHAFTKALVKFEELIKQYYGKPITFILHKNSALGLEKQYFEYMAQGKAVDYGIVSPAHMSTFSKAAPFIDAPFLFRDLAHWNKVLDADVLKPVADEIAQKADVMLIGYAGGGIRNIFINKPMGSLAEIKGLKVRVQGAPIWSKTFQAVGMAPTVIAYNEVYNGIQNGVIQAGENEAAGVESMKFYEVAPHLAMTAARHHHPADLLLGQDVQEPAGRPAGRRAQGRQGGGRLRPQDRVLARTSRSSRRWRRPASSSASPSRTAPRWRSSSPRSWRPTPRRSAPTRSTPRSPPSSDAHASSRLVPAIHPRSRQPQSVEPTSPQGLAADGSRPWPDDRVTLVSNDEKASMTLWRKFTAAYAALLSWLLVLSVAILVIPVSLQIFSRYTALIPSYIWTEEMARFLFIWTIMIGAMIGVRESTHFEVDVWPQLSRRGEAMVRLARPARRACRRAACSCGPASSSRSFAWNRTSELADLPLWLIHVAWPVTGVTWIVFLGEQMVDDLKIILGRAA